jgi:hypothetical protein
VINGKGWPKSVVTLTSRAGLTLRQRADSRTFIWLDSRITQCKKAILRAVAQYAQARRLTSNISLAICLAFSVCGQRQCGATAKMTQSGL